MRIGVMGAGAVGSYYGALLARGGHDVTLVGRPAFAAAVQAVGGLQLTTAGATAVVPLKAATDAAAVADAEVLLFCVKSSDTEAAGRQLQSALRPECVVLSLQNGVDNPERLAAVLGRPVVPTAIYVGVEMAAPGHVRHLGRGQIIMGEFKGGEALAATFSAAGIPTTVSAQVKVAQWQKLIINCAYNALSAATRMPYGVLAQVPGMAQVMVDVAHECVAVGRAAGVPLPDPDLEAVLGLATLMPEQMSSTAQDLLRGKPTEIEYLNGYVVRRGGALGVPTPANGVLLAVVRALESDIEDRSPS